MSVALKKNWSPEQFFAWAEGREGRYEFDGSQPVAMTGGTVNHGIIMRNLHRALDARLRGTRWQPLGPDVGLATEGGAIRYPDALVTCGKLNGTDRTVPDVVVAFEIVGASSGRVDRIVKPREYAAVASMRRYVIVESVTSGLLVLHRRGGDEPWIALALTGEDLLELPEIDIRIPVAEFYEGVEFSELGAEE
jgi:Uma2 family endonuclease